MAKMEVVSVRPIPGSNGRGYEVEVTTKNQRTPKRRESGEGSASRK